MLHPRVACGGNACYNAFVSDQFIEKGSRFVISLLLLQQIAQLFLCVLLGWIIVKAGLLKPEDSRVLSVVTLYVVTPCVIIHAFQIECTPAMLQGLGLALGAALLAHGVFFLLERLCRKPLRLNAVEQASLVYPNAANLTIPIVSAIFGPEWVIFTSMYSMVQLILLWSHGRILLSGERAVSLRTILWNVNILSTLAGAALFFLRIPLPAVLSGVMSSVSSMIGPISMLVAGMLMGGMDLRRAFARPGVWKVAALRLVLFPLVVLALVKAGGFAALVPNGDTILLISLLAAMGPAASTVTQMAQIYGRDGEYASSINVATTLLCIVTMPLLVGLYQL